MLMRVTDNVTNAAKEMIDLTIPYFVDIKIQGSADLMMHRYTVEAVEEKTKAKKNSTVKKTDNIESYLYRNDKGEICLPGEYLRQSIIAAAKFQSDPRSPRKSAMDLYKAAVVDMTGLAPINGGGVSQPDYLDTRRVVINRSSAVPRTRPCFLKGWTSEFTFQVLLPEYIEPHNLQEALKMAGNVVGVGNFRPTYGRFNTVKFEVRSLK